MPNPLAYAQIASGNEEMERKKPHEAMQDIKDDEFKDQKTLW